MEEEPYKNRELQEMFKSSDERADSFHGKLMQRMDVFESNTSTDLLEIKNQTTKTNGRVTALERWQYIFTGGLGVLTVIVVPLLAWALWVLVNIQDQINKGVDQALSAYEIHIK